MEEQQRPEETPSGSEEEYTSANALEILVQQHRDVEDLFAEIEVASEDEDKEILFYDLADSLVIHARIEERHFYPAVRNRDTEQLVKHSYEAHEEVKQLLASCLRADIDHPDFDRRLALLRASVERHVEEEEGDLFPKVRRILDQGELEAVGQEMLATAAQLEGTDARNDLLVEHGLSSQ
jgi:hemerythrin superfamily protein